MQQALQLTHAFWGGRFNPLIPVGTAQDDALLAESLIDVFQVDTLYPIRETDAIKGLIEKFSYLMWPTFDRVLFSRGVRGNIAEFLDIYHPTRTIFEEHIKDKTEPRVSITLYEWSADDPLRHVFQALFGQYPPSAQIGKDYPDFVSKNLRGEHVVLDVKDAIPADAFKKLTPSVLSAWELDWDGPSGRHQPGFYVGEANDFDDLVNFWNLRAANIDLIFYDRAHAPRFDNLKAAFLEALGKRPPDPVGWSDRVAVWAKSHDVTQPTEFGPNTIGATVSTTIWNGRNVVPRRVYIEEHSVLASVDESGTRTPSVSFQLPKKPFFGEPEFHEQKVIASVRPILDFTREWESTIRPPHIPELNEYYGREAHFIWNEVRSEHEGIGIVTSLTQDHLTIRALPSRELISRIFAAFGMKAEPSRAGLVASRLIRQMGGLQGCRVFKIRGVRQLIEKYGPLKSFTRSGAIQIIGQNNPQTGQPNFEQFEQLYMERQKLNPERAFEYLLTTGVFQVGLKLKCSNCELDFWIALDDVATEVRCGLCGRTFNITTQLRGRDWAYRRSGLFGREDHQEGSVPVALTLQQMDTVFSGDMIFSTAMNVTPISAAISPCETDFVLIGKQYYGDRVPLAIGESKSNQEITEEDVEHLKQVADAFPFRRVRSYIIFSKTSGFTAEEVSRCRAAQDKYQQRVILLSERELEPYFVYKRTEKEFDIRRSVISLEDMAIATQNIYFEPRRKPAVPPA